MKKSVFFASSVLIFLVLISSFVSADEEKITSVKDGIIKINGIDYNVKTGSKFIINNDELTVGTSFVAGKDGGIYRIKGTDIKLPENSKILFESDRVVIELPDGSKLDTLKIMNKEQALGSKFVFKSSEKEFNLPSGDLFTGKTLTFEIDKNGKNSLYFFDKEARLDGLKVSNPESYRVDLDLRGQISKSYIGNYISIDSKNSKLVIGKNNPGAGVVVEKIGENIIYQAGKDADKRDKAGSGTIAVDTKEKTKVETYGDFKIKNGELVFRTGIDAKGVKNIFIPNNINKNGKESSYMEIISYDENGNSLAKNQKIIINNENGFKVYDTNSKPEQSSIETGTSSGEKPRVTFNEIEAPTKTSLNPETANIVNSPITGKIDFSKLDVKTFGGTGPYSSALQDLKEHNGGVFDSSEDGPSGDLGHGTTHGLNEYVREKIATKIPMETYSDGFTRMGGYNGFYLLNGEYVVLKEPNIKLDRVVENMPSQLKTGGFADDYTNSAFKTWNNQPLYIFDELTAYANGGVVSAQTGRKQSVNIQEFMASSLALGKTIQQSDSNYWNSNDGEKFKVFLAYSLERSMSAEIQQTRNQQGSIQKFNSIINDDLKRFAIDTYGAEWTQRVLGF